MNATVQTIDRTKAVEWANAVLDDKSAVIVDTETTGLHAEAELCDIAIIAANTGEVLLDTLVRPSWPIPDEASAIHGITNEMVQDAPTWARLGRWVSSILYGRNVVIYNATYDTRILRTMYQMANVMPPANTTYECAMLKYGAWNGTPSQFKSGGYKWWKLDLAAAEFGVEPGGHRALADCIATRGVIVGIAGTVVPSVQQVLNGRR